MIDLLLAVLLLGLIALALAVDVWAALSWARSWRTEPGINTTPAAAAVPERQKRP
jgi:hypothetical protein